MFRELPSVPRWHILALRIFTSCFSSFIIYSMLPHALFSMFILLLACRHSNVSKSTDWLLEILCKYDSEPAEHFSILSRWRAYLQLCKICYLLCPENGLRLLWSMYSMFIKLVSVMQEKYSRNIVVYCHLLSHTIMQQRRLICRLQEP